jgi:hypothetical protein
MWREVEYAMKDGGMVVFKVSLARAASVLCLVLVCFSASPAEEPVHPTIAPAWVLKDGDSTDSSPALAEDGTIYVGTFKGRLLAVDPDGRKKWEYSTGHEIRSSPAVGTDGTIYIGGRDRNLHAITPAGQMKWQFKTDGWVDASPAIASDNSIIVGSWDGNLYSISPAGGLIWSFKTSAPIVSSAAIGTNGNVCFGSHDGFFYMLEPNGRELWRFKTAGAILSSPALDWGGNAYFASTDGNLYALNPKGEQLWKVHTSSVREGSPVVGRDGRVFLGTGGALWAVRATGEFKRVPFEGETVDTAPVVTAADEVIFLFRNGQACAYTAELEYLWRSVVYSCGNGSPSITADGRLYVPGWVNVLTAVPCRSSLAFTPWPKFRGNLRNTGNLADVPHSVHP